MEILFSTKDVARVVGASERQLGYWATQGLLRPSARDATGRGSRRRYTFRDMVALKTVAALRKSGCSLKEIRTAVNHLRKHFPEGPRAEMLSKLTLLTDGKQVYMLSADDLQVSEVISRQFVWSVPLGLLIQQVQNEVKNLPVAWQERVQVGGQPYRLDVIRDAESGTFTVQCRELPAAISEGDTAEEAITNGKEAIRTVMDFMAKRRRAGVNVKAG